MSAVRMVTCDVCKAQEANPSGWFTVRQGTYASYPAVFVEGDRERMKGFPAGGLKHACSRECLAEAVKKAVEKWVKPAKQKEA